MAAAITIASSNHVSNEKSLRCNNSPRDKMSAAEISSYLVEATAPRTLQENLAKLKKKGLIEKTGVKRNPTVKKVIIHIK